MASCVRMDVKGVLQHFQQLEDPRSSVNLLHPLDSVVVIAEEKREEKRGRSSFNRPNQLTNVDYADLTWSRDN